MKNQINYYGSETALIKKLKRKNAGVFKQLTNVRKIKSIGNYKISITRFCPVVGELMVLIYSYDIESKLTFLEEF